MRHQSRGFSLIELIAVLIILGALSVSVAIRFGDNDAASVQSSRDMIVSALFSAQQIAMARADADNPVTLVLGSGTVSVTENGVPLTTYGDAFPQSLPTGVQITTGTGNYLFDKLGRTSSPGSITITRNSVSTTLVLEASGYAHW